MKTIKKQVEEIFDSVVNIYPSKKVEAKEGEVRIWKAIFLLAQQIDILHEYKQDAK